MGLHYVNKCILLDEQELDGALAADFDALEQKVQAECASLFEEEDSFPVYEYLGFTSERFDRTAIAGADYAEPEFLAPEHDWWANVTYVASQLGGLPEEELAGLPGGGLRFEASLRSRLEQLVRQGDYQGAQALCVLLDGIKRSGLPGFREEDNMTMGGDADALDFRSGNHGTGSRIVAEIAFVWD